MVFGCRCGVPDAGDTLNRIITAAAAAAPYLEIDYTMTGSALREMTEFLEGHGALPAGWDEGTDRQRVRYFTWTLLSSTGNTDLTQQEWSALADWEWYLRSGPIDDALAEASKGVCPSDPVGHAACVIKPVAVPVLEDVFIGALSVATAGAAVGAAGSIGPWTAAWLAGTTGGATASAADQWISTGSVNPETVAWSAILGGGVGVATYGAIRSIGSIATKVGNWWETGGATNTADDLLPGLPSSAPKPAGLGSTGRTTPSNLTEQLAMTEVRAAPAGQAIRVPMTDPRWPAADGWMKMAQNVNGVEIHYVLNTVTGAVDDFKFVLPPPGGAG